ncbi:MAG: hypothetical protein FJ125_17835 [Deltaproteobacteria bacterium]|nr:hypothetical protein [Deltaproteobacteria bacterium]
MISDVTGTWRDASILDLGFDARQRLLIATDGKGLFRLEEEGCTPLAAGGNGLDGRLGRLGLDATGEIWVAGGRVLLRVTSRDEPLTVPVPQGQEALGEVRSLRPVSTPARGLWLAGGNGVAFTGLAPP